MDDFDRAKAIEEFHLKVALYGRGKPQGESLTHCLTCGGKIPLKRRLILKGVKYCHPCQTQHEKATKGK